MGAAVSQPPSPADGNFVIALRAQLLRTIALALQNETDTLTIRWLFGRTWKSYIDVIVTDYATLFCHCCVDNALRLHLDGMNEQSLMNDGLYS